MRDIGKLSENTKLMKDKNSGKNILVLDLGSDRIVVGYYKFIEDNEKEIYNKLDIVNLTQVITKKEPSDTIEKTLKTLNLRIVSTVVRQFQGEKQFKVYLSEREPIKEDIGQDSSRSVFDYWYEQLDSELREYYLRMGEFVPNPKFLLHIHNEVSLSETLKKRVIEALNLPPSSDDSDIISKLVSVLITQVINLAIHSLKKEKYIKEDDVKNTQIILSFPNIYSPSLIKDVIENIQNATKGSELFENIEYIYESDAVGVECMTGVDSDGLNLIIDVGKGTTDIGIIGRTKRDNRKVIYTVSRVGLARAGGYISFIIAALINRIWNDSISDCKSLTNNGEDKVVELDEFKNIILGGEFNNENFDNFGACIVFKVYKFIEEYKSKLDENFKLKREDIKDLKEKLNKIFEEKYVCSLKDKFPDKNYYGRVIELFKKRLEKFLDSHNIPFWKTIKFWLKFILLRWLKNGNYSLSEDMKYYWFKKYLEKMIKHDVIDPIIESLDKSIEEAKHLRNIQLKESKERYTKIDRGAVVGRGSMFKPLRKEIFENLSKKVREKKDRKCWKEEIDEEEIVDLKLACVRGSMRIIKTGYKRINNDVPFGCLILHPPSKDPDGTYSFRISHISNDEVIFEPDVNINDFPSYDEGTVYYLPYYISTNEYREMIGNEESTPLFLFIGKVKFEGDVSGGNVFIRYDRKNYNFEMVINGKSLAIAKSSTGANYPVDFEEIYASIWPAYIYIKAGALKQIINNWSKKWSDEEIIRNLELLELI